MVRLLRRVVVVIVIHWAGRHFRSFIDNQLEIGGRR
jgi:hypothetical protein